MRRQPPRLRCTDTLGRSSPLCRAGDAPQPSCHSPAHGRDGRVEPPLRPDLRQRRVPRPARPTPAARRRCVPAHRSPRPQIGDRPVAPKLPPRLQLPLRDSPPPPPPSAPRVPHLPFHPAGPPPTPPPPPPPPTPPPP